MELIDLLSVFAGLGIVFFSTNTLAHNLKQLVSHSVRVFFRKHTYNAYLNTVWGTLASAIAQSASAISFIIIGLVTSNALSFRRALPLLAGNSIGITLIPLLVTFNTQLAIFTVLGFAGISFAFVRRARLKLLLGAVTCGCLLLVGFSLIRENVFDLSNVGAVQDLIALFNYSYVIPFLVGVGLIVVVQSEIVVMFFVMSLARGDVIELSHAFMFVYAISFGRPLFDFIISKTLRGIALRTLSFNITLTLSGSLVFLGLFYVEEYTGLSLVYAFIDGFDIEGDQKLAMLFFFQRVCFAVIAIVVLDFYVRFLERLVPAAQEDILAKPKYIQPQMLLEDNETTLNMIDLEHYRIIKRLPLMLSEIREEGGEGVRISYKESVKATRTLLGCIDECFEAVTKDELSPLLAERFLSQRNQHEALGALVGQLERFIGRVILYDDEDAPEHLHEFFNSLVESMHACLSVMVSVAEEPDEEELALLLGISSSKDQVMIEYRKRMITEDATLTAEDKGHLLEVSDVFQKSYWLINDWTTSKGVEVTVS